jgi:DNA-binding transcriptional ArsR family regulator
MRPQTLFRLRDVSDLLLTRADGRTTASKLRKRMLTPADFVLDFSGVKAATPSFLDEICSEIDVGLRRHRDDGVVVFATHMRDEVVESFLFVLERHRHSLAYLTGDDIDLLNGPPHLVDTLRAAVDLGGEFTVTELAERLDLQQSTVNERLADLLESGAVGRERDRQAERGRRYRYRTPSVA